MLTVRQLLEFLQKVKDPDVDVKIYTNSNIEEGELRYVENAETTEFSDGSISVTLNIQP